MCITEASVSVNCCLRRHVLHEEKLLQLIMHMKFSFQVSKTRLTYIVLDMCFSKNAQLRLKLAQKHWRVTCDRWRNNDAAAAVYAIICRHAEWDLRPFQGKEEECDIQVCIRIAALSECMAPVPQVPSPPPYCRFLKLAFQQARPLHCRLMLSSRSQAAAAAAADDDPCI